MFDELMDKGQQAELDASSEILTKLAALIRACPSTVEASDLLIKIGNRLANRLPDRTAPLYDALSNILRDSIERLPELEAVKSKMRQIERARAYMADLNVDKGAAPRKSELIAAERWAISELQNMGASQKDIVNYLQRRYGEVLKKHNIGDFTRQDVTQKMAYMEKEREENLTQT